MQHVQPILNPIVLGREQLTEQTRLDKQSILLTPFLTFHGFSDVNVVAGGAEEGLSELDIRIRHILNVN
jgi:hypothetical protein